MTNLRSSLLRISIVIPDFKSHNFIMSARVYFVKTVNGCKDVSKGLCKMNSEDDQLFTLLVYYNLLVLLSTTLCS